MSDAPGGEPGQAQKSVLAPFLKCFRTFDALVHGIFGENLSPSYMELINDFGDAYKKLKLDSMLPKTHIIVKHIPEYVKMTGRGLGLDSEQSCESSHYLFCQTWDKYRIKDKSNPNYHKAMMDYNSCHV